MGERESFLSVAVRKCVRIPKIRPQCDAIWEKEPLTGEKEVIKETFGPPRWRGGFASLHRGNRWTPLHASQRVLDNHPRSLDLKRTGVLKRARAVRTPGWLAARNPKITSSRLQTTCDIRSGN